MQRFCGLFLLGGLMLVMAGCGGNSREGHLSTAIEHMNNAATQISGIKDKINEAVKKAEKEKAVPDFKEAVKAVDELKIIGKQMQKLDRDIEEVNIGVTDEERKDLADRYKDKLQSAVTSLYDSKKQLNETIHNVEKTYKEALKDLRTKLNEAEGEFEVLARQR
ncbi:MAG: hypothetical protein L0215_27055 [Gemmataceae bacterium]|nr:hypothetical protein [Gemmataceae bacterium]